MRLPTIILVLFCGMASGQTLFTASAKEELLKREALGPYKIAENGFSAAFNDIVVAKNTFIANPTKYRWAQLQRNATTLTTGNNIDAPVPNEVPDILHLSGLWAAYHDDVMVGNLVVSELLAMANEDDFDFSNGVSKTNLRYGTKVRWISTTNAQMTTNPFLFIHPYMSRNLELWSELKHIQTKLSIADVVRLNQWFTDYNSYLVGMLRAENDGRMGSDWINGNFNPDANQMGLIAGGETDDPIRNADGSVNTQFIICGLQDLVSNRAMGAFEYVHAYGIEYNVLESKKIGRAALKFFLEFGTFADGTFAEMHRVFDGDATKGFVYGFVSIGALDRMAHHEKVAAINGLPSMAGEDGNYFWDFKTSAGITKGQIFNGVAYEGSSTTGGPKSLLLLHTATSKYYRNAANGGWNDLRFAPNGKAMDGNQGRKNSYLPAIGNLYYDNQEISDWASYNISKGHGSKALLNEDQDRGPFGSAYKESIWMDMADYWYLNSTPPGITE